jgi:RNA polymerase sigma factor (sigma-70 family)
MMSPPRDTAPAPAGGFPEAAADLTDGQLLDRFVTRHDGEAFAALLRRHGPLVLGVCRRVLSDPHDAEDAFQATFLVLVRKAASIVKQQSLGSWLYGVACRIAVRAKHRAQQRRVYERQAVNRPTTDPCDEALWRDLRPVLDEEVNRLPEKYRAPVVLCYLAGRAYAEAARELGCSKGTVALRLEQARERLRRQLTRRGIVLSVGVFAALFAGRRALAPVPPALAEATARAASLWATGGPAAGAVPVPAASLAEAVASALAWAKVKVAVVTVLAAGAVCATAGAALHRALADRPAAAGGAAAPKQGRKTLADRREGLPPLKESKRAK